MESLNNLTPRGRMLLLGAVSIFLVIPLLYFVYSATSNNNPEKVGKYYDKASGETVTNNRQTPESFGVSDVEAVTYLGLTPLTEKGLTKYQLLALKTGLYNFAKTVTEKPLEMSVDKQSITEVAYDSSSSKPVSETSFTLLLNRKSKYKVKLQYSGISVSRIYVSTLKGEQLFDSQEINGSKITN